jgi:glycosyltransferase involved in cell wall biosynthesis
VSNWEGLPLSCLEALAFKIPILVTPGTNLASDVRNYRCGLATEVDDESIVQGMIKLYSIDRVALQEGCENLIKQKYNWYSSTKILLECYKKVLPTKI